MSTLTMCTQNSIRKIDLIYNEENFILSNPLYIKTLFKVGKNIIFYYRVTRFYFQYFQLFYCYIRIPLRLIKINN